MNSGYDTERVMRAFKGEAFKEKYKRNWWRGWVKIVLKLF